MNYSKPQTETVTFLDVTEPSEEIKKQLSNEALLIVKTHEQSVQKLLNTDTITSALTIYQCSGQLSLSFSLMYNLLAIHYMDFKGLEGSLTFQGSGNGNAHNGGVAWFTGAFTVPPNALTAASEVHYTVLNLGIGTKISFYINDALVGALLATGLLLETGIYTGSGTFKGNVHK